jgi:hypothetical protein
MSNNLTGGALPDVQDELKDLDDLELGLHYQNVRLLRCPAARRISEEGQTSLNYTA